jgi:hypothetical protein
MISFIELLIITHGRFLTLFPSPVFVWRPIGVLLDNHVLQFWSARMGALVRSLNATIFLLPYYLPVRPAQLVRLLQKLM